MTMQLNGDANTPAMPMRDAKRYVASLHRHHAHQPLPGHKLSLAVEKKARLLARLRGDAARLRGHSVRALRGSGHDLRRPLRRHAARAHG